MDSLHLSQYYNKVDTLYAVCERNTNWQGQTFPELKIGNTYKISHIGVLRSSTKVMLQDFPDREYTSGFFTILENGEKVQDTEGLRFVAPYLRRMYLRTPLLAQRHFSKERRVIKEEIEKKFGVTLLGVFLGGSRFYGTGADDSDWDMRFIYERPASWYEGQHNEQETIEHVFWSYDVLGWELSFAKKLIKDCEPEIISSVQAPVIGETEGFADSMIELAKESFDPDKALRGYLRLAKFNLDCFKKGEVFSSGHIHALRCVLSCIWIEKNRSFPCCFFMDLLNATVESDEMKNHIRSFVDSVRLNRNKSYEEDKVVYQFIKESIEHFEA